jgi:hypothetical protein
VYPPCVGGTVAARAGGVLTLCGSRSVQTRPGAPCLSSCHGANVAAPQCTHLREGVKGARAGERVIGRVRGSGTRPAAAWRAASGGALGASSSSGALARRRPLLRASRFTFLKVADGLVRRNGKWARGPGSPRGPLREFRYVAPCVTTKLSAAEFGATP